MTKKHTYTPPTTAQRRRLLFTVWEETGDRSEACRQAQVSESTFYNWKRRYEREGLRALDEPYYPGRSTRNRKSAAIEARVIELARQHMDWGKKRLANHLAQENNGKPLVSVNTVQRILEDAGLWHKEVRLERKGWPKPWSVRGHSVI